MVLCYLNNKISLGLIAPPLNLKIENQKFSIFLENGKSFCLYVQIIEREPKNREVSHNATFFTKVQSTNTRKKIIAETGNPHYHFACCVCVVCYDLCYLHCTEARH